MCNNLGQMNVHFSVHIAVHSPFCLPDCFPGYFFVSVQLSSLIS
jgi:hypothetical protein